VHWCLAVFAYLFWVHVVVGGLGTVAVAAMMAVMQVNSVSFMPAFGLASGGAILVGQAIGAERRDEVPALVALVFRAAAAWQGVVGVSYLLVPALLLAPLAPPDARAEFLAVGARILVLSAAWQLFDAAANSVGEALRAAGDTVFLLAARLVVAWAVFAPGGYLAVRVFGWRELGAALWLVAYLVLLAVVLYLRFNSGAWRKVKLIEPQVDG
jgi:MATE family multidrug resistance protein